jgi:hypothetical protein
MQISDGGLRNARTRWAPILLLSLCSAGLAVTKAHAADPSLGNMVPQGGQRGTEVMVHFYGNRIGQEPQEIVFYNPGITASAIKPVDGKHFEATLTIASDCRLGFHPVRVRTTTGLTRIRTFHVGALKEINEAEPNSQFSTAQAIELDVTVNGVIKTEDVDYFVVEAKAGQRITVEIEGLRLGRTFFDPHLAILNAERFELATCDDSALLAQDSVVSIVAPEDGRYIIGVRDSSFGGNDASTYRLHIGRFGRPMAVMPAGGRPGETLDATWLGDIAGDRTQPIVVPTEPRFDSNIFFQDDQGIAPSPNVFRVNDLENVMEAEPNNRYDQATAAKAPAALNGVIGQPGDVDHFRFEAKKGQVFDVHTYARRLRSPLDSLVRIRHVEGKYAQVAANDDNAGKPDSYFRFTAPADGQFDIEIHDHLRAGGPTFAYRIEVTPPVPKIEVTIAERQRWVATKLEVPRGNRTACLVKAARRNFGGPLNIAFENLPTGVTVETPTMAANRGQVPVILSAAADAPLATGLSTIVARPAEEEKTAESSFMQRTWLVRGANNVEVWSHYADRAAVATTNEVPFAISVVQPKVPLVRGGSMQLKVVAERAEGFVDPIRVFMLYNPQGVSSSRSIKIAKDQSEAVIPLTANGSAPLLPWDICVEGRANINGRVIVATPFAKLIIQEPYVAFSYPKAAVEIGQALDYPIGVEVKTPFEGSALVTLLGMPAGVTAEPLEMTKETKELKFHIKTTEKSPPGRHKTLICQFSILQDGEPIAHSIGTGELRIDKPLPTKKEPPKKEEKKVALK